MREVRLHLGCGDFHLFGDADVEWVNIDSRMQSGVDRVDNIGILRRYRAGSIDEIYCSHALDHFSRWDYPRVLSRWHELLMPGGILRISVIDFQAIATLYGEGMPLNELTGCLVAAQDYESNVRHMHWDLASLMRDLMNAGFVKVRRDNAAFQYKDCSNAKLYDKLISLNIVAEKKH